MLATSVFLFCRMFHFDPFITGENDHLEIVLKSLAAAKIFLVYKKARGFLSLWWSERIRSSRRIFMAGRVYSCWKWLP